MRPVSGHKRYLLSRLFWWFERTTLKRLTEISVCWSVCRQHQDVQRCFASYTHSDTHTHTHTHTHSDTHIHTVTHTHIRTHTHTYLHTYTHTNTQRHTHTYLHTNTHTYIPTHTQRYIYTHTYTHAHTHAHTHTRASAAVPLRHVLSRDLYTRAPYTHKEDTSCTSLVRPKNTKKNVLSGFSLRWRKKVL